MVDDGAAAGPPPPVAPPELVYGRMLWRVGSDEPGKDRLKCLERSESRTKVD